MYKFNFISYKQLTNSVSTSDSTTIDMPHWQDGAAFHKLQNAVFATGSSEILSSGIFVSNTRIEACCNDDKTGTITRLGSGRGSTIALAELLKTLLTKKINEIYQQAKAPAYMFCWKLHWCILFRAGFPIPVESKNENCTKRATPLVGLMTSYRCRNT